MNAEQFLQLADARGFLEAKRLAKIREQIQSSKKPVSAGRIAKALVDKGLITKFQAKTLLDDLPTPAPAEETVGEERSKPTSATPPKQEDSSIELAPIDDDKKQPVDDEDLDLRDVCEDEQNKPPVAVELELLDAAPELELLDEPAGSKQIPEATELLELDDQAVRPPTVTNAPAPPVQVPAGETADVGASEVLEDDGLTVDVSTAGTMRSGRKQSILAKLTGSLGGGPKKQQSWDSPLMLVGGGSLLLMIIFGGGLYYFLNRETGDQVFAQAEEDYRAQSYLQAISKYERFLDRFPSHPKASVARVRQSLARLRQAVEGGSDWERALETTAAELPKIKSEEAFGPEARPELSRLLPDIYAGFVEEAKEAGEPERKQYFLDKSQEALALVTNPEYLPASLRKTVQLDIEKVDEEAALIVREINRDKELTAAVEQINGAAAAQDTAAAYAIRNELLSRYPGLASHPELVTAVREITRAERENVTVSNDPLPAANTDHNLSAPRRVALATRQTAEPAGIPNRAIYVLANGALYGLDANEGTMLWRRWSGYANSVFPQPLSTEPDADVLAFDEQRRELVRLHARDGQLGWRLPLDDTIATPMIDGNRIEVTTHAGRVLWVDAKSGQATPVAQLPQALSVAPGFDHQRGRLYQVGEHSSLYVLSADTLNCDEVTYLGHRPGSVAVPAVPVSGYVFVAENGGDYARLHVLLGDNNGLALRPAIEPIRLDGEVVVPMQAFGRRLLVVTDRGALLVFDVEPGNASEPVRTVARTLPANREKGVTFSLVDNGRLFVADDKLAFFELQASRGELVRKWVDEGDEIYIAPLQIEQDVLICVRRDPRTTATQVLAIRVASGRDNRDEGKELWTTELGAAPALPASYDAQRRSITVVSRAGGIWDVDASALDAGKVDKLAARATRAATAGPWTAATTLADGRVILAPQDGSRQILVMDPTATQRIQNISLSISQQDTITPPVGLGNAILVCSSGGTIHSLDPGTGTETLLPYQPGLSAGRQVSWLPPAVIDANQRTFVAAESTGTLHLITPQADPQPHLAAAATTDLQTTLAGVSVVGNAALVVARGTSQDELRSVALPSLEPSAAVPLGGRVTWGPSSLDNNVALITTDTGQLHAVTAGPQLLWSSPLKYGALAGARWS